jgi:hypothetical protein
MSLATNVTANTDDDHVSIGDVQAVFHAYLTGGRAITLYADANGIEMGLPVLDPEVRRGFIIPWLNPPHQYFYAEDAHWTMYALTIPADTMREAQDWFDRRSDEFVLIHPDGSLEYLPIIRMPIRYVVTAPGERAYRTIVGSIFDEGQLPAGDYMLIWLHYMDGNLLPAWPSYAPFTMM